MAGDHADVPFVQCKGYTKGRAYGPPIWIVWHDMEASELPSTAENTAAYGANPTDGRQVSWHYAADNNSVVQCVRLADTAWTVGNIGNDLGINWEFAGFASQSRADWLDAYGISMLDTAIPIMVRDMRTYGIPARWLTDDQVKAKQKGLTTHNQLRRCFGGTTHTDPGENFPFDYVLQLIKDQLNGGGHLSWSDQTANDVAFTLLDGGEKFAIHYRLQVMRNQLTTLQETLDGMADLSANKDFVTALAKAIVLELRT